MALNSLEMASRGLLREGGRNSLNMGARGLLDVEVEVEEAVTTSGGQFFGVPTQDAIDRRNWELYGIPIPSDEPDKVKIKTIRLKQPDGSYKSYEIVKDREVIEQFNVPLSQEQISKVRNDLLSIDPLPTIRPIHLGELDDEEAIVLLMMQM